MRFSRIPPLLATLIVTVAVVAARLLVGTRVATTFLDRLVSFDDYRAVATLIAVTGALVRHGVPYQPPGDGGRRSWSGEPSAPQTPMRCSTGAGEVVTVAASR